VNFNEYLVSKPLVKRRIRLNEPFEDLADILGLCYLNIFFIYVALK